MGPIIVDLTMYFLLSFGFQLRGYFSTRSERKSDIFDFIISQLLILTFWQRFSTAAFDEHLNVSRRNIWEEVVNIYLNMSSFYKVLESLFEF